MPISRLNKLHIGITSGDVAGIGPEIILKSLAKIKSRNVSFLIIGDYSVFRRIKERLTRLDIKTPAISLIDDICNFHSSRNKVNFLDLNIIGKNEYKIGIPNKICGEASVKYIVKANDLVKDGIIDALVTAPINKEAIQLAGYNWPGHTELLAHLTKTKEFAMMFVAEDLKVILVTTHMPLSEISRNLKTKDIFSKIKLTDTALKEHFLIKKPLIGVSGLNPHASDGGLFGKEEENIILPAVKRARSYGIRVKGPESAESLFYQAYHKEIDALICMYHDQALIPIKMILRDKAVNFTIGLPYIRTSPSSGTAYDISSKLIASYESMTKAIELAINLTKV